MDTTHFSFHPLLQKDPFSVKLLNETHDIKLSHRLRYDIFCEELGWVPKRSDRIDTDDYDNNAVYFGVFNGHNELLAFLRIIRSAGDFMLENEFRSLVCKEYRIKKDHETVEISRLCVTSRARSNRIEGNFGTHGISILLYKAVYQWCVQNNIRYLYCVVERTIFRLLNSRGFTCRMLGFPQTMPDGTVAVAAMIDWREFEQLNAEKRPALLYWFNQDLLVDIPVR